MNLSASVIRGLAFAVALSGAVGLVLALAGAGGALPSVLFLVCGLCGVVLAMQEGASRSKSVIPPPPVGSKGLAAYRLQEKIGAGSMGEVWKATHQLLGRACALKRIKSATVDSEDIARFKREARATSALLSPHTIDVFDFGEEGDSFYYVMEYLDGVNLQTLVSKHGPLPPSRVIHLMVQACHSLAEAHERSVVHRDIKPANLMLCRYGLDLDFIKLLDFGLAKHGSPSSRHTALTAAGTVLGTAAYIAPESLSGSARVDARADIYAVGAVMFWLLSGRLLFEHDRALEMARAHLTEVPPRVSTVSKFEVPAALDELIAQCLEKQPDQRPQSASEVRERLLQIETEEPWTHKDAAGWWQSFPSALK